MTTYLDLAKKLHQEAGLSGTGPASVLSQVGMAKKVVDWVSDAWDDLQALRTDWKWMWKSDGLITMVPAQRGYDLVGLGFLVNEVVRDSIRIRISGEPATERWLTWLDYEDFRAAFMSGVEQSGQSTSVTVDPAGYMKLNPVPDAAYEVRFEYYKTPTTLVNNTDEPDMPERFQQVIVWSALMSYCAHDENVSLYQAAEKNYRKWLYRVRNSQLPTTTTSEPMA